MRDVIGTSGPNGHHIWAYMCSLTRPVLCNSNDCEGGNGCPCWLHVRAGQPKMWLSLLALVV